MTPIDLILWALAAAAAIVIVGTPLVVGYVVVQTAKKTVRDNNRKIV